MRNRPVIEFTIYFSRERDPRRYRARVKVLFRTENVIRYSVRAGEKEIEMEKFLYRKSNQWKVEQMNFIRLGHTKTYEKMISDIQAAIDEEMKKY
jgi:CHAT domain-containing protein